MVADPDGGDQKRHNCYALPSRVKTVRRGWDDGLGWARRDGVNDRIAQALKDVEAER